MLLICLEVVDNSAFLDILLQISDISDILDILDILWQLVQNVVTSRYISYFRCVTLENSLICILLSASHDVLFDKRMIWFSGLDC